MRGLGRLALALALLAGCSSNDPPPADAGGSDAARDSGGGSDAATSDAATSDAATSDAATSDAATSDAAASDAAADAGSDAGASCEEVPCGPSEYCEYGGTCGRGGGGRCVARPDVCTEDCPGVCGCDGRMYCNECIAASMGVDVDPEGTCMTAPDCDAFDARGEGPCRTVLGVRWTGDRCEAISGCSCVGTDCGRLYSSLDECNLAHSECVATPCARMDARGEGLCALFLGYAWDGRSCTGVSGCSCVGEDCGRLYENLDDCRAAYAGCVETACGGFLGSTCGPTEWCDYIDVGTPCGFADGGGVCRPRPELCAAVIDPVCGCDGNTYDNECEAQRNGQDIQHSGACRMLPPPPPPAD